MNDELNRDKTKQQTPASILFLCLARNCEPTLPSFFSFLSSLRESGLHSHTIIGENGSTDRTRLLIENAAPFGVQLLDTTSMANAPSRLARMATGRQLLLDTAKTLPIQQPEFICIVDLDNVILRPPEPATLIRAMDRLRNNPALFAVGANSHPFYYDLLSLRADGHDYTNLNAEIASAKKNPLTYFHFHKTRIYRNQQSISRTQPLYCDSSFNGCCIYRSEDFYAGTYLSDQMETVCEHVTLNLSIGKATGKRMMIDPALIVQSPADHKPVTFLNFWLDRLPSLSFTHALRPRSPLLPGVASRSPQPAITEEAS